MAYGCASSHRRPKAAPTTTVPPTTTTVPPTTTTTPPPPVAPLTGLLQPNAAQLRAPAVVVKIDNIDDARPQTSVNQADVVYEEMVEGGLTRLAAVFQSHYPTVVGPVRSGRLTDIAIVDNLNHPALVFAGANGLFMPTLRAQPVDDIDIDNKPGFFTRDGSRAAPHNLYTNVAADGANDKGAGPPAPLFTYRIAGAPLGAAGTRPASVAAMAWPAASVEWRYQPAWKVWYRMQNGTLDVDRSGLALTATNVVIQAVPYVTSAYANEPSSGITPIPKGKLYGTGNAWILSGGATVAAHWTRSTVTGATTYTDGTGHPINLAPGRTWVELIQAGTAPAIH
ncbi:MAG: DUF3048 domain-containing protein [Acidimicrobiaceae bacterium]|nr:DUF3048 domain-containing protein [Acidimicrobiaceae bacterium]